MLVMNMVNYNSYFRKIYDYEIYFCEDCIYYDNGICNVNKNNFLLKHFNKKVKSNHKICNRFKRR